MNAAEKTPVVKTGGVKAGPVLEADSGPDYAALAAIPEGSAFSFGGPDDDYKAGFHFKDSSTF